MREGVEEDGVCFHGDDGWFPQKFEVIEGGEGKLELPEVFKGWHELWCTWAPSEVIGKAVTGPNAIGDESGWC